MLITFRADRCGPEVRLKRPDPRKGIALSGPLPLHPHRLIPGTWIIRSADQFIDSIGAPGFRIASLNDIGGRPPQRVSSKPCKRTII